MVTLYLKQKLNQKIYIVDCEYLYKTSDVPNYKAMKLYSYHTQIGNHPIFISEEYQLTNNYDLLYLIRELRHTPFPPGDIVDDKRTILIGKEFELFEDVQEIPLAAAVCRPDYNIYQLPRNHKYANASFVQFFQDGKRIKNMQDWHRAKSNMVVVVDLNFWDASPQGIVDALNDLVGELNIVFMAPVKLKKLLNEDVFNAFTQLKLAKFYKIRYNNNIGEDFESISQAVLLLERLKQRFIYLNLSSIPVKIITKDHWSDKANILYDFERCLKIMTFAQKHRVRINFKYPKLRLASPSWAFFEFFKTWSNHYHTLSYIEALLKGSTSFYRISYADLLSKPQLWTTAKIKQAVHLIGNYPELMKAYAFTGWGGVYSTTAERIDFAYVKEKAFEDNLL